MQPAWPWNERSHELFGCRWVAFGVNFGVTAAFGEFLCVQQELKEIPLASIPRQAGKGTELTSISTRK